MREGARKLLLNSVQRYKHSQMLEIATSTAASGTENQDRVASFRQGDARVLVVSDGAGGGAGGACAAQHTVDRIKQLISTLAQPPDADTVCGWLASIDQELASTAEAGECTGVVLVAVDKSFWGASVGDSAVWMVGIGPPQDLTSTQNRKPLLGSSAARPVAYGPHRLFGSLVVATDGLFNYVAPGHHLNHSEHGSARCCGLVLD